MAAIWESINQNRTTVKRTPELGLAAGYGVRRLTFVLNLLWHVQHPDPSIQPWSLCVTGFALQHA